VSDAPRLFTEVKSAVLAKDFERLAPAVEQSALMMHASMLAAAPALIYFRPATLAVIELVRAERRQGSAVCFTIDAGPHVKVLCEPGAAEALKSALAAVPGVLRVLESGPGPDAQLSSEALP
jgi:diphosphomevalonate decarboxylase